MPSHQDADLILHLYELRREETMRKARKWFVENYYVNTLEDSGALCPAGSQENAYLRMVTSYWEMAASFVTAGILNMELFFQSNQELLLVWTRVRPIAPEMRKFMKNANVWKNLETVGDAYIGYFERTSPGAYEAFRQRIGIKPQTS